MSIWITTDPASLAKFEPVSSGFTTPVKVYGPQICSSPVVFSFAHSGREYPDHFLKRTRLDLLTLRSSEDAFVDQLYLRAAYKSACFIHAMFPRSWVDANRHPEAIDPKMFHGPVVSASQQNSPQVLSGLGVLPKTVAHGEPIFSGRLDPREIGERLRNTHTPYHQAVDTALKQAKECFGWALLVDCHSMPANSALQTSQGQADIVLGDRHGASCNPWITEEISRAFCGQGLVVDHNTPYAGGYSVIRYANPSAGVHTIQIEISRSLYMHEATLEKHAGFLSLQNKIRNVMKSIALIGSDFEPHRP